MKNWLFAAAAICLLAAPAEAHDRRIMVINHTDEALVGLYASNTGEDVWKYDMLGGDTLGPHEQIVADLNDNSGYCKYDLLAVMKDGSRAEKYGINACVRVQWDIYD
jgi:hypothetical protein